MEEMDRISSERKSFNALKNAAKLEKAKANPDEIMNAVNQMSIFNYSNENSGFHGRAIRDPDCIDWTLAMLLLTRYGGFTITGLAETLAVSRDHLEGVAIGKINKPRDHAIAQLSEWIAQYVAPSQLRMVIV